MSWNHEYFGNPKYSWFHEHSKSRIHFLNIDHNFQSYAPIDAPDVGATRADGPFVPPGSNTDTIVDSYTVGATHLSPSTDNSLGLPFNSKGLHFCNILLKIIEGPILSFITLMHFV